MALAHLYITKKLVVVRRPALVVSTALPNGIDCLGAPRCKKKEVQALPLGYLSNNLVHSPKVWCGVL
jgi:hypothetical protein